MPYSILPKQRGFTLVEVLIAILIGTVAVLGVYRLFSSSLRSYNLQDQLSGMYQNGTYTIKKMSELLMQAGVDLPQANYTVLYVSSPANFNLRVNPTGAVYVLPVTLTNVSKIPDSNSVPYLACDSIVTDEAAPVAYDISSVDTIASPKWDTIRLSTTGTFAKGTTIYGFRTVAYSKQGNVICSNSDTLAENIDSLCVIFYDKTHVATTTWNTIFSAYIYIRVRTSQPDPKYRCPGFNDGYRRLPLTTEVRLRNKF